MNTISSNLLSILSSLGRIVRILFRGWSIRKVINFSNLLKLVVIYVAAISWVIFFEFDLSPNFWQKSISGGFSERRFAVYSVKSRIGEKMLYERLLKYANMQGYDYVGGRMLESNEEFVVTAHLYKQAANLLNFLLKPDFNLAVTHHIRTLPNGYNIAYLNVPRHILYDSSGKFSDRWSHLNDYDAYLDIHTLVHGENEILRQSIGSKPVFPAYIAKLTSNKPEIASFKKALITGTMWGCARGSIRTRLALKHLAEEGLLTAVGTLDYHFLGENYLGKVEKIRREDESVDDALHRLHMEHGISLIFHNMEHRIDGVPTSRISEAMSAGNIIISDQNIFLEKFFANQVLFFDADLPEQEIYEQIKDHIGWIHAHPDKVRKMAMEAYEIFQENFTIEKQMEQIFSNLEKTKNQRRSIRE